MELTTTAQAASAEPTEASDAYTGRGPVLLFALACLVVFFSALAPFLPALSNELLPWDDRSNIIENPLLNPLSWHGVASLWTRPYDRLYVPMFYTSFVPELAASGDPAQRIHATNLLLHGINSVLAFLIIRLFLPRKKASSVIAAAIGALVFAMHPLQTESVAWATGRKDLLSATFTFVSVIMFMKGRASGRRTCYVLSLVGFAFALLSKPASVALPLALLGIDLFTLKTPLCRSLKTLAPWFVLGLAWAVMTALIQSGTSQLASALPPAWTRPFVAADALLFYGHKLVWPVGLSPVYGRVPWTAVQSNTWYVALPVVVVSLWLLFQRRSSWATAAAISLALLLPVTGIVPFDYQLNSTVADRYMYAPMLGVALAFALLMDAAMRRGRAPGVVVGGSALAILMTFGLLSSRQTCVWKNPETLWMHAYKAAPDSAVVQNSAGMVFSQKQQADLAEKAYLEAVRIRPGFAVAHNNLANLYSDLGRIDDAVTHYDLAIEADPGLLFAQVNLATTYASLGKPADAETHARAALKIAPGFAPAVDALVRSLESQGRLKEALPEVRAAVSANPGDAALRQLLTRLEAATK